MSVAVTARYRLGVASRCVAAAGGAYAAAALLAILLGVALPGPPIDRAIAGTLTGVTLLPIAAIACFWVRSAARAWGTMLALCLLLAGGAWAAGWRP